MDFIKRKLFRRGNQVPIDDELETWSEKCERKNSIYIIHFTMFLMTLGFSIVLTGGWPYLKKLDHNADKSFWSYVVAANPFGQVLFSTLIGWWGNKRKSPRLPMIVTLSLFVLSSGFYSLLDVLPIENKRYYIISARFFVGVSAANIAVARAYLSDATKSSERTHAVSMLALAQVIGFAVGPVIQSAVTKLGEDGYKLFGLTFNMYTTPGWINSAMGILNIILFLPCFFKQHKIAGREAMKEQGTNSEKEAWKALKPNLWAVVTLIGANFILVSNFVLLETLATPLTMEQFAWSAEDSIRYMGWLMGIGAFVACFIFLGIEPLCRIFAERKVMLWGGFFMMLIGRIFYIPYGTELPKIAYINSTVNLTDDYLAVGCPSTQKWCFNTPKMSIEQFIIGYGFTTLGYPIGVTLAQTIFSKILGPRPQGVWMGFMTGAGSLSRVIGPVAVENIYTNFGTYYTWGITGLTLVVAMIGIMIVNKRLIPKSSDLYIEKNHDNNEIGLIFNENNREIITRDIEMQLLNNKK